jgi:DNA-binding transcriptional MerR regulator
MAPIQNGESGSFFRALNSAFREMGIRAGHKLTEELNILSQIHVTPEMEDISGPFILTDDKSPKTIFYTSLIKHSLSAYLSQIQNTVAVNHSASIRRHGIMGLMKTISDMIIQTQSLNPESSTDRIIINRLLAGLSVLFSETVKLFPHDYDPVFIRVSNADIKNILTSTVNEDKNTETLFSSLAGKYFPMSERKPEISITTLPAEDQKRTVLQHNEPVNQKNADALIINEVLQMQEILSGLKEDVSGIKEKQKIQPDTNDRRIGSAEVCELLHISKSTLQAHRQKGLYSFTKIGSRYLYSAKEINEILRLNKGK